MCCTFGLLSALLASINDALLHQWLLLEKNTTSYWVIITCIHVVNITEILLAQRAWDGYQVSHQQSIYNLPTKRLHNPG